MAVRDEREYDINIDVGADFTLAFTVYTEGSTPVDLTGAIVSAHLREYPEGTEETLFTCSHNGSGGQIVITLPHETTAQLGYSYGWYDVRIDFPDQTTEEALHGKAFIVASVTRYCNPGTIQQIVSFNDFDEFPTEGNIYRLYLDQSNYNLYWWNGEQYVSLTYAMRGEAATIAVDSTVTLEPTEDAYVQNLGNPNHAQLKFGIPKGPQGDAGSIEIGTVTTGEPGTEATITNVGTETAAIWDITIPRGNTGFVSYPTFDVNETTGDLIMYPDSELNGSYFSLSAEGDLLFGL